MSEYGPQHGGSRGLHGRKRHPSRPWPNISLGLIGGAAALSFERDYRKDSERLRILISMTIWAIWKPRNKYSINDQDVASIEIGETLKELIRELVRKSRNATRLMEGGRREIGSAPKIDLSGSTLKQVLSPNFERDVAGLHRRGGVLVGRTGGG